MVVDRMTAKQFELEVLHNNKYVIAEFDKDNYYLDDENSAKSLECRLNELFDENIELKNSNHRLSQTLIKLLDRLIQLEKENEQLKQDRFICLDCKHSGYTEIGCLCEKKDHWADYKTECGDYEELE